jgi:hypothetical protein
MTDLQLNEIAAKWLGLEIWSSLTNVFIKTESGQVEHFDPLNNDNDLWKMVVPKLSYIAEISVFGGSFEIIYNTDPVKGNLSDLPRAILELVAELYESEVKG